MRINIVKPIFPKLEEIKDKFASCLQSGLVTNNSKNVREFQNRLKEFLASKYEPLVFCNGEMALYNLILAWKFKMGYDFYERFRVIVPSFTFSGTVNAIVSCNLEPVFCDVDETLTIDLSKLPMGASNIKMIVPVAVYGNLPNIEGIIEVSRRENLTVVFDNAPAFGSKYKGKYPAEYNIEEIYSFHATKVFSSMEGGCAITNKKDIFNRLCELRDFGQYEKKIGDVALPGLNSKMQEISAIIGIENLQKLNNVLENRKKVITKYNNFFNELENKEYLKRMKVRDEVECIYLYYPIILSKGTADDFIEFLANYGISSRRYYTLVHMLKYYKDRFLCGDLSYSEKLANRIVALPLHSYMDEGEIGYLFEKVEEYFKKK